jgi:hypothetical protein
LPICNKFPAETFEEKKIYERKATSKYQDYLNVTEDTKFLKKDEPESAPIGGRIW